jgi:hypothetical protein
MPHAFTGRMGLDQVVLTPTVYSWASDLRYNPSLKRFVFESAKEGFHDARAVRVHRDAYG